MNVVAFNGSPRPKGNTSQLIEAVLDPLRNAGIGCETIQIGGQTIRGCTACMKCRELLNRQCIIDEDIVNDCIAKMDAADAILIGTPTYFANVTTETKGLMDRAGFVLRGNGNRLSRKVGAAAVAVRRAGAMTAFHSINDFFYINDMIIPGSSYWSIGIGRQQGDVQSDDEGLGTMKRLGENMVWLLEKLC